MSARPTLLVVIGSRRLRGFAAPHHDLERVIDETRPAWVVTNDAYGPAQWAIDAAKRNGLEWARYRSDGTILCRRVGDPVPRWTRVEPPQADAGSALWGAWWLHRDRVMVRAALRRAGDYRVEVLALRASWAGDYETDSTVGRATALGLPVTVWAWRWTQRGATVASQLVREERSWKRAA